MRRWTSADGVALTAIFTGTVVGATLFAPGVGVGPEPEPAFVTPSAERHEAPEAVFEEGPVSDPVAFHATSFGMGWDLEGDYAGALSRVGDELRVSLSFAVVRASAAMVATPGATRHLRGVRLALAEDAPEGWHVVEQGPLYSIDADVPDGSRLSLEGVTLTLDGVPEDELVGRWLVIVHELGSSDDGAATTAWTYAHAEPDLIPRLLAWVEDGC